MAATPLQLAGRGRPSRVDATGPARPLGGIFDRARRPSPCPVCDQELETELAAEPDPVCPRCEAPLLPVRTAGAARRLAAALLDAGVLALTALPLHLALLALVDPPPLLGPARTPMGWLLEVLAADPLALLRRASPLLLMGYLYFVLYWSLSGTTLGGRLLALRVVGEGGAPPRLGRTLLRAAAHLLGLLAGTLGWTWALFDLERRALHDKVAGTWVIRAPREVAG